MYITKNHQLTSNSTSNRQSTKTAGHASFDHEQNNEVRQQGKKPSQKQQPFLSSSSLCSNRPDSQRPARRSNGQQQIDRTMHEKQQQYSSPVPDLSRAPPQQRDELDRKHSNPKNMQQHNSSPLPYFSRALPQQQVSTPAHFSRISAEHHSTKTKHHQSAFLHQYLVLVPLSRQPSNTKTPRQNSKTSNRTRTIEPFSRCKTTTSRAEQATASFLPPRQQLTSVGEQGRKSPHQEDGAVTTSKEDSTAADPFFSLEFR